MIIPAFLIIHNGFSVGGSGVILGSHGNRAYTNLDSLVTWKTPTLLRQSFSISNYPIIPMKNQIYRFFLPYRIKNNNGGDETAIQIFLSLNINYTIEHESDWQIPISIPWV